MKRLMRMAVVALLASVSCAASAQVWIGGNMSYNHSETGYDLLYGNLNGSTTVNMFTIAPEIGYNLSDKFSVAMALGYTHSDGSANSWDVNPYVRYHFAESGRVRFFIDGGVKYTYTHLNGTKTDLNGIGFGINPGVSLALNERLGLVAHFGELSYSHAHVEAESGCYSNNNFIIGLTNNISFGLYINL